MERRRAVRASHRPYPAGGAARAAATLAASRGGGDGAALGGDGFSTIRHVPAAVDHARNPVAAAAADAPVAASDRAARASPPRRQCKPGRGGMPAAAPAAEHAGAFACQHPSRPELRSASARPVPRRPPPRGWRRVGHPRGRRTQRAGRGPREDETRVGVGDATACALRLLQQVGQRRGARDGARDVACSRQGRRRVCAAGVAVARARCRLPGRTLREHGAAGSRGVAHSAVGLARAGGAAQLAPAGCRGSVSAHGCPGTRLTKGFGCAHRTSALAAPLRGARAGFAHRARPDETTRRACAHDGAYGGGAADKARRVVMGTARRAHAVPGARATRHAVRRAHQRRPVPRRMVARSGDRARRGRNAVNGCRRLTDSRAHGNALAAAATRVATRVPAAGAAAPERRGAVESAAPRAHSASPGG